MFILHQCKQYANNHLFNIKLKFELIIYKPDGCGVLETFMSPRKLDIVLSCHCHWTRKLGIVWFLSMIDQLGDQLLQGSIPDITKYSDLLIKIFSGMIYFIFVSIVFK